jgi:hypothetical protein
VNRNCELRTANRELRRQLAFELVEQRALGVEEIAHDTHLIAELIHRRGRRAIARTSRELTRRFLESGGSAMPRLDLGQQVSCYCETGVERFCLRSHQVAAEVREEDTPLSGLNAIPN